MTYAKRTGLFWDKVNTDGECWTWTACKNKKGYGEFHPSGSHRVLAHRYAYEQVIGLIPAGTEVCHTCDNRACVRPAHLFAASHADNVQDMMNKQRHSHGIKHRNAKLTDEQVVEIRSLYDNHAMTSRAMARKFGIAESTVWQITSRRNWRHL